MLTDEHKNQLRIAARTNAGIGPIAFDLWYSSLASDEREFVGEYLTEFVWDTLNDILPDTERAHAYFIEHLPALEKVAQDCIMAFAHAVENNIRWRVE